MRFRPNVPSYTLTPPLAHSDDPSVFAFSLAKAGSTLLYDMLSVLAPAAGMTFYSAEDALFAGNVSSIRRPGRVGSPFSPKGYCFGGFRQFPAYPIPILGSSKAIFLVRDPRDMAVSLFFSLTRSHVLPEGDKTDGARGDMIGTRRRLNDVEIDDWIANSATVQYTRMFEGYIAQGFLWRPNVAIYRYEDVIFEKAAWIDDICDWFGWHISQEVRQSVVDRFDLRPDGENPDAHVRQVTPGNYVKHLAPRTIHKVNSVLAEYMRIFGYID